ncbi:MAG: hypothetical protein IPO69_22185 [Saprospiraceae bacterium]|nr:hypothetical protein [Saprospiraceae bacterium]
MPQQTKIFERSIQQWHQLLADYFEILPTWQKEPTRLSMESDGVPTQRKLTELPYQQSVACQWDKLKTTLCDLSFVEAKCISKKIFDLLQDCDRAIELHHMPDVKHIRNVVSTAISSLIARPGYTAQSLYNRLRWISSPSPLIEISLAHARSRLNKYSVWICAEAPLPNSLNSSVIRFENSEIQFLSSPNQRLAIVTAPGLVNILKISTGELVEGASYRIWCQNPQAISFEDNGQWVVYMDKSGSIGIGEDPPHFVGRKGEKLITSYLTHGVVAVRQDNSLVCWNPKNDKVTVLTQNLPSPLIALRPSIDGKAILFVAGYQNQTIGFSILNGNEWETRLMLNNGLPIVDASLDLNAGLLLLATIDSRLSIFEMNLNEELAHLFYERHANHPIRGMPLKCSFGSNSSKGWAFVATNSGQVLGWNWKDDIVEPYENYRSLKVSDPLVLLEVLPSSGKLFVSTTSQSKILSRLSIQDVSGRHQEPISSCIITCGNKIVSASKMADTIQWFSSEGLVPIGVQICDSPTVLIQYDKPDATLVGNTEGLILEFVSDKLTKKAHLGESVTSLLYQKDESLVIAAGVNGNIMRYSLIKESQEVLWHSTGYQRQIKILHAGLNGLFWSLYHDEKKNRTVLSLVDDIDHEKIINTKSLVSDFAVASDTTTIVTYSESVEILIKNGSEWKSTYQRYPFKQLNGLCFLGRDYGIVVVMNNEHWLEVWQ